MALIFLDANVWLGFWKIGSGRHSGELIPSLLNLADQLFIPEQTVLEVTRNKLDCFTAVTPSGKSPLPNALPAHLWPQAPKWREAAAAAAGECKRVEDEWQDSYAAIAQEISLSTDHASTQLKPLFDRAVPETKAQLERARLRRERGNPPGKRRDALGDQICWEQLLDAAHHQQVWLVSDDGDFSTKIKGQILLNPALAQELSDREAKDVRVFRELAEMIKQAKVAGLDVKDAPPPERLEEIAKEEKEDKRARRYVPIVAYGTAEGPCPSCSQDALVGPAARPGPFGFAWYSTCTSCGALVFVDDYCD